MHHCPCFEHLSSDARDEAVSQFVGQRFVPQIGFHLVFHVCEVSNESAAVMEALHPCAEGNSTACAYVAHQLQEIPTLEESGNLFIEFPFFNALQIEPIGIILIRCSHFWEGFDNLVEAGVVRFINQTQERLLDASSTISCGSLFFATDGRFLSFEQQLCDVAKFEPFATLCDIEEELNDVSNLRFERLFFIRRIRFEPVDSIGEPSLLERSAFFVCLALNPFPEDDDTFGEQGLVGFLTNSCTSRLG